MVQLKEKDWRPIEEQLTAQFWEWYYKPILDLMNEKKYNSVYNANNALIAAIRSGRVKYKDGKFTGSFNASISRDLRKFSEFDARSKTWIGRPPSDVTAAAVVANDKAEELNKRILSKLDEVDSRVKKQVSELTMNIQETVTEIDGQLVKDVQGLTVMPEITEGMRKKLEEQYTANMRLNIVNESGDGGNWNAEQIRRLRESVEKNIFRGSNRQELMKTIQAEFNTTKAKAQFLARQETSLMLSTMRNERYTGAGLKWYVWLTSNDIRVVGTPGGKWPEPSKGHGNHFLLNNKICSFSDPTIYADSLEDARKGKWKSKASIQAGNKHPGEEFLDRCTARPIIE